MKKKTPTQSKKANNRKALSSSLRLALESRLVFDGAIAAMADLVDDKSQAQGKATDAVQDGKAGVTDAQVSDGASTATYGGFFDLKPLAGEPAPLLSAMPTGEHDAPDLIVADTRAPGLVELLARPPQNTRIELINPDQDGFGQISQILSGRTQTQSLTLLAAGEGDKTWLGATRLDGHLGHADSGELAVWGDRLTTGSRSIFMTKAVPAPVGWTKCRRSPASALPGTKTAWRRILATMPPSSAMPPTLRHNWCSSIPAWPITSNCCRISTPRPATPPRFTSSTTPRTA